MRGPAAGRRRWSVYMVRCGDGSLYTGIATDVARRLDEHRDTGGRGAKYLRGRGPLKLVLVRTVGGRGAALRLERRIKALPRERKRDLIARSDLVDGMIDPARRMAVKKSKTPTDELQTIPGIGPSLAGDLRRLGIRRVRDLKGRSPQALYRRLCRLQKVCVDRCVLYAFRCAVYFAGRTRHDPELLKWWNWKDREDPS